MLFLRPVVRPRERECFDADSFERRSGAFAVVARVDGDDGETFGDEAKREMGDLVLGTRRCVQIEDRGQFGTRCYVWRSVKRQRNDSIVGRTGLGRNQIRVDGALEGLLQSGECGSDARGRPGPLLSR